MAPKIAIVYVSCLHSLFLVKKKLLYLSRGDMELDSTTIASYNTTYELL